ncbi:hypothetical protein Q31b_05750 [Novipirellula aureliae]|uniref:Mg-protoporphyrin IX methyl transferase n=2 Tax=Novipirellula aureliae TaxID=2527966 RepID=A0A5C6E6Y0_9BACT|nr:hypothetical protein Q31b_05750 [Novipirellula aureliae]
MIPSSVDRYPIPSEIRLWIIDSRQRIEVFHDRWDRPQIEQFVAADYELVYQSIAWMLDTQPLIGSRFLEWGCGFAVVSALASTFHLDVIGIEAETELLERAKQIVADWKVTVELVTGNFLPPGSESLADDPTLPSLGHQVASAYDSIGLELDDFAVVYSYPWPGEDDFHERVFANYAAPGAMLMQFCGPNDVRLWRKVGVQCCSAGRTERQ